VEDAPKARSFLRCVQHGKKSVTICVGKNKADQSTVCMRRIVNSTLPSAVARQLSTFVSEAAFGNFFAGATLRQ
jgi:hypothetical protein